MTKILNATNLFNKDNKNIKIIEFLKVFIFLICLLLMFFLNSFYFKPNSGIFIGSGMDSAGNVYVLGVNDKESRYKITKINSDGIIKYEKNLENKKNGNDYYYRNIEVDTEGNFYVIRELKDKDAIISSKSLQPIIEESVIMYDTDGNLIKTLAQIDMSEIPAQFNESGFIKKIQIINQKLNVITAIKNIFSVSSVSTVLQENLIKNFSFEVSPSLPFVEKPQNWVNDLAVLSNGRVFYSTKSGDLIFTDDNGNNINCKSLMPDREFSVTGISIDSYDNIYFTDLLNSTFYKLETSTMNLKAVYFLWDSAKKFDVRIRDLRRIKAIDQNNFYAASKNFDDPFYVKLGNDELLVDHIKYSYFSWFYLRIILAAILLYLLILIIFTFIKNGMNRVPLSLRIISIFLPILILTIILLMFFITNHEIQSYKDVISNHQITGALIASDKVNGDKLQDIVNEFGFNSPQYSELNFEVKSAYDDVKNKVGDKSDYIVAYAFKKNKIYSFANIKYSSSSKSYNELKFADPDMINAEPAISDTLLESNEISEIQRVREELLNGKKISHAIFNDVHGNLDVYFAPIKNSSDEIVGFIGNFLDEGIHIKNEFNRIFLKSLIMLLVISILIFMYLYFILKISLKPLQILRDGIESIIKGNKKTRIKINSKDEIQDISIAFNDMNEKIESYTDNLIEINKQYLRFIPKELLNLLGKERITEVDLSDNKETSLSILYITFNIDSEEFGSGGGFHNVLFNILGKGFANLFNIVEKNSGVVQSFSGLGATILFPHDSIDALNTASQITEMKFDERIIQSMRMSLGFGNCLIGVIGSKTRCGVSIMSDEILRLIDIDAHIQHLGIKYTATQNFIKNLNKTSINHRYLGECTEIKGVGNYDLYEFVDCYSSDKKNLYKKTKNLFEEAVRKYYEHDFKNARKIFSDVIKINEDDKVAIYYLYKCDMMGNSKTAYNLEGNKNLF